MQKQNNLKTTRVKRGINVSKGMKRYSNIQETRIAKDLHGKTKPGSGSVNITGLKGDVDVVDSTEWSILVEAKTRAVQPGQETRSITFKKEWIKEVQNHAFEQGKSMGVVAISFDNVEDFYTLGKADFINTKDALVQYEKTIKEKDRIIESLSKVLACLSIEQNPITIPNRLFESTPSQKITMEYQEDTDNVLITIKESK